MDKEINNIITSDFIGKHVLACFRFSYPVLVLHLSYMTESANERFGLERFIIKILVSISDKGVPFPYEAVAALCGIDQGTINNTLRDLLAAGLITTVGVNTYRVLETTKARYIENIRSRERKDQDFPIDSISRKVLPADIYRGMSKYRRFSKLSDVMTSVGMTDSEKASFADKLTGASEIRKESLGFPADADEFRIENATESQLDGFCAIYSQDNDGNLERSLYYEGRRITTAFCESAPFKFGIEYRNAKLAKRGNMPQDQLYALSPSELKECLMKDLQLSSDTCIHVGQDMRCTLSVGCLEGMHSRDSLFGILAAATKEIPIYSQDAKFGVAFFNIGCGDEELEKLLRFYIDTKGLRNKADIVACAERLKLPWRQSLVKVGRHELLESIDITEFIKAQP